MPTSLNTLRRSTRFVSLITVIVYLTMFGFVSFGHHHEQQLAGTETRGAGRAQANQQAAPDGGAQVTHSAHGDVSHHCLACTLEKQTTAVITLCRSPALHGLWPLFIPAFTRCPPLDGISLVHAPRGPPSC